MGKGWLYSFASGSTATACRRLWSSDCRLAALPSGESTTVSSFWASLSVASILSESCTGGSVVPVLLTGLEIQIVRVGGRVVWVGQGEALFVFWWCRHHCLPPPPILGLPPGSLAIGGVHDSLEFLGELVRGQHLVRVLHGSSVGSVLLTGRAASEVTDVVGSTKT